MGWSLKRQLVMVVALIVVPLIGLTAFVFYQIRDYSERELARVLTSATGDIAQRLQNVIGATGDLAIVVRAAWTTELDCDTFLGRIHAAFPRYNVVGVGDANGRLICSSPPGPRRDISDRDWFQTVLERQALTVGSVQVSRTDGTPNMVVTVPFTVSGDAASHSVGAGLRLDWLSNHLSSAALSEHAIVGVLDHDLKIVARTPDHDAWVGRDIEGDEARALIERGGGLLSYRSTDDQVQRRFHGRWVEVGGRRFFVYYGLPERVLTELARQVTLLQLGAISLGGLALLLVTGFLMRRQILEPLSSVQRFAERIARGEFQGRLHHRNASTEVASLLASLHTMADTLARNAEDIAAACRLAKLGYWRIRRADRTMIWSRELLELFGTTSGDGIDALLALAEPDDRARVQDGLERAIADGTPYHLEFRIRRPDGARRAIVAQGEPAAAGDGDSVWLTGVCQDVTEQRELEDRVRQVQRLEAVGQLTGGIAHDFNNLLTVIIGNADMLAEQVDEASALRTQALLVRDAALRASELTQRLLAFSRRQRLEAGAVDVNRLIGDMGSLLSRTLGSHIEIVTHLEPGLGPAWVDESQLESALLNLSLNARDAMPQGGTLTLATEAVAVDADNPRNADLAAGEYICLTVSDTGEGMTDAVRRQAFEPYFTTKDVGKGSGLGLSMVYGFAQQSQGHVEIDSAPGSGTRVRLYVPRSGDRVADRPAAPDLRPASGDDRLILLVEDDALVQDYTRQQLETLGFRVATASTGPEALALLDRIGAVDLLLTDVVMPGGMTGLELAEAVRERLPHIPVVLTSGFSDDMLQGAEISGPGVHVLGKPYRQQALASVIRRALG